MLNLKVILKLMFTHGVIASNMERMKTIKTGMTVSWLNMKRYPNRVLDVVPIASYSTTSKEKCGSVCLKTPACKSLNLKQESAFQYQCELLDTTMFETNCKFMWDEVISHYEFVSDCTKNYSICEDPLKICVPDGNFSSYTCQIKQNLQPTQTQFCPTVFSSKQVINVAWQFPYCGLCRHTEDLYILWNKHNWNCNRTWEEYKSGFGKIHSDTGYWIGLEILHQITNPPVKLHVFCDYDGKGWNLDYDNFTVSSEKDSYRLNVDYRQGESKFVQYHSGKTFSTFDRGNNQEKARLFASGWWYGDMESANWFYGHVDDQITTWNDNRCNIVTARIERYL